MEPFQVGTSRLGLANRFSFCGCVGDLGHAGANGPDSLQPPYELSKPLALQPWHPIPAELRAIGLPLGDVDLHLNGAPVLFAFPYPS